MDVKSLRQFIAVAEELNFRRAAARLHLTQPPLTVAIQKLEAQLGTALFRRSRQSVSLTPAGSALLADARKLVAQADRTLHKIRKLSQPDRRDALRISCLPSALNTVLAMLLDSLRRQHPDLAYELSTATTERQLANLAAGRTDLGIVVTALTLPAHVQVIELCREQICVAVPRSHPFAMRPLLELSAAASEDFVGFRVDREDGFDSIGLGACRRAGFSPRVVREEAQMDVLTALVGASVGLALLPASVQRRLSPSVSFVPAVVDGSPVTYPVGLAFDESNENEVLLALHKHIPEIRSRLRDGDPPVQPLPP